MKFPLLGPVAQPGHRPHEPLVHPLPAVPEAFSRIRLRAIDWRVDVSTR